MDQNDFTNELPVYSGHSESPTPEEPPPPAWAAGLVSMVSKIEKDFSSVKEELAQLKAAAAAAWVLIVS